MMNHELGGAVREVIRALRGELEAVSHGRTAVYLLQTLAHIVEGKTIEQAFGAPGDWGYGTAIGEALRRHYAMQACCRSSPASPDPSPAEACRKG